MGFASLWRNTSHCCLFVISLPSPCTACCRLGKETEWDRKQEIAGDRNPVWQRDPGRSWPLFSSGAGVLQRTKLKNKHIRLGLDSFLTGLPWRQPVWCKRSSISSYMGWILGLLSWLSQCKKPLLYPLVGNLSSVQIFEVGSSLSGNEPDGCTFVSLAFLESSLYWVKIGFPVPFICWFKSWSWGNHCNSVPSGRIFVDRFHVLSHRLWGSLVYPLCL